LGSTLITEEALLGVITSLEKEWPGDTYDALKHNSAHFCEHLCSYLGSSVQGLPTWVFDERVERAPLQEDVRRRVVDEGIKEAKQPFMLRIPKTLGARRDVVSQEHSARAGQRLSSTARGPALAQPIRAQGSTRTLEPVLLHVYNLGKTGGTQALNEVLRPLGTGAFHCGVEVYKWEWSYSDTSHLPDPARSGVFSCLPRGCHGHTYLQSVPLGATAVCEREMMRIITLLEKKWPGSGYHMLKRNCGHFCDEFCRMLGVDGVPPWITNLAGVGAKLALTAEKRCGTPCCCLTSGRGAGCQVEEVDVVVHALPALESDHE
jgi:hypothetical protein